MAWKSVKIPITLSRYSVVFTSGRLTYAPKLPRKGRSASQMNRSGQLFQSPIPMLANAGATTLPQPALAGGYAGLHQHLPRNHRANKETGCNKQVPEVAARALKNADCDRKPGICKGHSFRAMVCLPLPSGSLASVRGQGALGSKAKPGPKSRSWTTAGFLKGQLLAPTLQTHHGFRAERTLHHDPQICEVANNSKDSSVSKNQSVSPATSSSKQTCPAREDIEHVSQTISIRPPTWWKARCWHQS